MVRSATVARGREGLVDQRSFTHRAGALHVSPNRVIANPILLTRQGICCFNTPPTPALTADLGQTGATVRVTTQRCGEINRVRVTRGSRRRPRTGVQE